MTKFTTLTRYEYTDGDGDEYLVNPFDLSYGHDYVVMSFNGKDCLMSDETAEVVVEMLQQALADRKAKKKDK